MNQYVGLDVSLEETKIHVLDEAGGRVWRGKCASHPDELETAICKHAPGALRIGLETGPLTTWLWTELSKRRLPMVCLDARAAQRALDMRANKTDANDAEGLAHLVRAGWYKEVRVKSRDAMLSKAAISPSSFARYAGSCGGCARGAPSVARREPCGLNSGRKASSLI